MDAVIVSGGFYLVRMRSECKPKLSSQLHDSLNRVYKNKNIV